MMKKIYYAVIIIIVFQNIALTQLHHAIMPQSTRDTVFQSISMKQVKDSFYLYAPQLPALGQIAGAPRAYYDYFWEFGDGGFSFDQTPAHTYKNAGTYKVQLFVTNYFDDGKAPVIQPLQLHVTKASQNIKQPLYFFNTNINGSIGMKNNRDPVAGEDFVTVIGYRNRQPENIKGSIVLFYNEKEYKENFALVDKRVYNRETNTSINTLLAELENNLKLNKETFATEKSLQGNDNDDKSPVVTSIAYMQEKTQPETYEANTNETANTSGLYAEDDAIKNVGVTAVNDAVVNSNDNEEQPHIEAEQVLVDDAAEATASAKDAGSKSNTVTSTRNLLSALKKEYMNNTVFRFDSLTTGEEKFIFTTMNALPDMLKDTNATIKLTALMIPDNPNLKPEKYELEMQIVPSHDPNRFVLKRNHIGYRFMGQKKELTYQVRFQNTGKGAAHKIAIAIGFTPQLDPSTFKITRISPFCDWCSTRKPNQSCIDTLTTGDSVYLTFKNIYIPGEQQLQPIVRDKDSTKGFVEYTIRFKKKPKKIAFGNSAKIVFDKNEPIYTNRAMARFKTGFSPGIVAGYNLSLDNNNYSAKGPVQIGYTLSPFSPYRPYFQVEAYLGLFQTQDSIGIKTYNSDTFNPAPPNIGLNNPNNPHQIRSQENKTTIKRNYINIVPLHFRYNISNWIGVGIGAMAQLVLSQQISREKTYHLFDDIEGTDIFDTTITRKDKGIKDNKKFISNSNVAGFIDLQVGRVRTGPTLGIRYLRRFNSNIPNQFFVYAAIKI